MALSEEDIAEVIEGVIEQWFPTYHDMGSGRHTRQYRVVAISDARLPGRTVYEVRDHNDGQAIQGRYVVNIDVQPISKVVGPNGELR